MSDFCSVSVLCKDIINNNNNKSGLFSSSGSFEDEDAVLDFSFLRSSRNEKKRSDSEKSDETNKDKNKNSAAHNNKMVDDAMISKAGTIMTTKETHESDDDNDNCSIINKSSYFRTKGHDEKQSSSSGSEPFSPSTANNTIRAVTHKAITRQGSLSLLSDYTRYPSNRSLLSTTSAKTYHGQSSSRTTTSSSTLQKLRLNNTSSSISIASSNRRRRSSTSSMIQRSSLSMANSNNGYKGMKSEQNRRALMQHAKNGASTKSISSVQAKASGGSLKSSETSPSTQIIRHIESDSFGADGKEKQQSNDVKEYAEHTRVMEKLRAKNQRRSSEEESTIMANLDYAETTIDSSTTPSSPSRVIQSLQSEVEQQAAELQRLHDLIETSSIGSRALHDKEANVNRWTIRKKNEDTSVTSSDAHMWIASPSKLLEKQSRLEAEIEKLQNELQEEKLNNEKQQQRQMEQHNHNITTIQQSKDSLSNEVNALKITHRKELQEMKILCDSLKKQLQHMSNDLLALREQKESVERTIQSQHQLIQTLKEHGKRSAEEREQMAQEIRERSSTEGKDSTTEGKDSSTEGKDSITGSEPSGLLSRLKEQEQYYETQLKERLEAQQQEKQKGEKVVAVATTSSRLGNLRQNLQRRLSLTSFVSTTEEVGVKEQDGEEKTHGGQVTVDDDDEDEDMDDDDDSIAENRSIIARAGLAAGSLLKQISIRPACTDNTNIAEPTSSKRMSIGQADNDSNIITDEPTSSADDITLLQQTIDDLKCKEQTAEDNLIMQFQTQLFRQHEIYDSELASRNRYIEHLKAQLKRNGLTPKVPLPTPMASQASSAKVDTEEPQDVVHKYSNRREAVFLSFPPKHVDVHQMRRQTTMF